MKLTIERLQAWVEANEALVWWAGSGSFALMIGAVVGLPFMVAMIPDDYFAELERRPLRKRTERPVLRWTMRIAKNMLGLFLLLLGMVLSLPLVPGQGLLIAFAGLLLLEFPGKRRFEMAVIRRRRVLGAINWLRARRGRPPLKVWSPQ